MAGWRHGYFPRRDSGLVAEEIRASGAEVLLVGLGAPEQELWLDRHLAATGARVGLAVGGLFDYYAGRLPRAPLAWRRRGLEWVWRLALEPRRLWRRYLAGNLRFLAAAWAESRRPPAPGGGGG
jgi:N-acetylglucosaminyldiphosphoundecaprenol N-acetyl-beta-D-mannosaminyltransferase